MDEHKAVILQLSSTDADSNMDWKIYAQLI